ncbi:MAG: hypothetical protein PHV57_07200 [Methanomicrobiaceae archaeon]|nr:hypothetical protein [Methanomicrobiaceae archaeon]
MGMGKAILEGSLSKELERRYGVTFRVYAGRGYHLMSEDAIRRDLAARKERGES